MSRIYFVSLVFLSVIIISSFNSCRDFLSIDDYTKDMLTYDSIFTNKENLEAYLWGSAAYLPNEGNIWGASNAINNVFPGLCASDEAFTQWNNSTFPGCQLVQGALTADNIGGTRLNMWPAMYKIIRKMNMIIANIGRCTNLLTVERNQILGYTYFLRAYAYYHLIMAYGPVVLVSDEIYETNMDPDYYNQPRATYDESVEYVCSEFERAARFLPLTVTVGQFGRPTRGAAYGMIARIRLHHASPLFNGGGGASGSAGLSARTYYGDWVRSTDGAHYVNQEYDEKRWALAAYAAYRVIQLGTYTLHTVEADENTPALPNNMPNKNNYPNGPGGIDPFRSYSNMFTGESVTFQNKEYVWGRMSTVVQQYTRHSFPADTWGGFGGMGIPQKIIDAYYLADGSDPVAPGTADCPYDEAGFMTGDIAFSGYRLGGGRYGVYNMYVNREARFYASIGFSQCFWPMTSTAQAGQFNQYFGYALDDNAGKATTTANPQDYNLTGYVSKKYIHSDDAWAGTDAQRINKPFGIIRYAEILLSYAEALNNLTQTWTILGSDSAEYTFSRDVNEIARSFNLVRYRAGLPGLTDEQLADKDEMFKAIERERMIEFFQENRRYYDIRRWGVYLERDGEPITGMDVEAYREDGYYNRIRVNNPCARNRVINRKMVWLPISTTELKKVPLMVQNPGW